MNAIFCAYLGKVLHLKWHKFFENCLYSNLQLAILLVFHNMHTFLSFGHTEMQNYGAPRRPLGRRSACCHVYAYLENMKYMPKIFLETYQTIWIESCQIVLDRAKINCEVNYYNTCIISMSILNPPPIIMHPFNFDSGVRCLNILPQTMGTISQCPKRMSLMPATSLEQTSFCCNFVQMCSVIMIGKPEHFSYTGTCLLS